MRGQLTTIQHLETMGADLGLKDQKGRTPLMLAETNRQSECINYLKSQTLIHKARVLVEDQLPNLQNALRYEQLLAMRNNGQDVRGHLVQQCKYHVHLLTEPTNFRCFSYIRGQTSPRVL